jgi:hypothetical protein
MPDFKPWQWATLIALLVALNIVIIGGLIVVIATYDLWTSPGHLAAEPTVPPWDIHLDTTAHPYAMVDRHADTLPGDRNTHAYVHPCTTAHFHAHANACLHAHTSTTIHQDADGDSHAIAYSDAFSHGVEHAQKTAFSDASQERAAYVYIQPVSDSHAIPHAHTVADAY